MKVFKLTSKNLKFWKNINLLDGQRKGEVIFRRVFVLIVGALILYLLLLVFVGKKDQNVVEVDASEDKVEWVEGNRIIEKADGSYEIVPKEVFMDSQDLVQAEKIERFFTIKRGNAPLAAHADKFVEVAKEYELDYRLLPAIATIESGGGKHNFRPYNAWGFGRRSFKSFDEGIEVVGKTLKEKYVDAGLVGIDDIARVYCPPNSVRWAYAVKQFMDEIESI